jgi:hypothetical protein
MACNCQSGVVLVNSPKDHSKEYHGGCKCCCCCSCCCCHGCGHIAKAPNLPTPILPRLPMPGGGIGGDPSKPDDPWFPIDKVAEGGPTYHIPPSTPEYPGDYSVWDPKLQKYVPFKAYVNGWCAMVWLVRTDPGKGGSSLSPVQKDPKTAHLVSDPPPTSVDKVAKDMRNANAILATCKVAFRVCEINILDARRLYWSPNGQKTSLAASFTNGETVINGPSPSFFCNTRKYHQQRYGRRRNACRRSSESRQSF